MIPESDDLFILDLFKPKRKSLNSKKKGNRVELELTKLLTAKLKKSFSRSVGSGNRWGQVSNMPSHAKSTLTGDICPPENFKWVIECKGGYEDKIDLNSAIDDGCACLDDFIKQSLHDHEACNRKPIIIWKRSRRPWLAMVRSIDLPAIDFTCAFRYREWMIVPLVRMLDECAEDFWFDSKEG